MPALACIVRQGVAFHDPLACSCPAPATQSNIGSSHHPACSCSSGNQSISGSVPLPAHPADHIPVSGIRLHGVAKRNPSSCMRYVAFHDALTAPTTTQDCVHACCPRLLSLRIHLWIFTPRPCLLPQNSILSSHPLPTPSRRLQQLNFESLPTACNQRNPAFVRPILCPYNYLGQRAGGPCAPS